MYHEVQPEAARTARRSVSGFAAVHPLQSDDTCQGMLQFLYEMQQTLCEISGLDACSLQPAAGAQGELTALFVAAAHFRHTNQPQRKRVLVPDSAHGTNPASAALAGFRSGHGQEQRRKDSSISTT